MSKVSIVKGVNPELMVKKAIDLIGGLDSYVKKGQKVFIKPNVCGGVPGKIGSFTSPKVIESTIRLLHKIGASVSVGEADSTMYSADVMLNETGIGEVAAKEGAEIVNLSKGDMIEIKVPNGSVFKTLSINKALANADAIISMPVMKTHALTTVTLGMKAIFGAIPDMKKCRYHMKIDQAIVDVNSVLPSKLTIVDATIGNEGKGPFEGVPINVGLVIAGNDVVSTDSCAAAVMGIDPTTINHLKMAIERGFGTINLNEIDLRGEAVDTVKKPFRLAKQTSSFATRVSSSYRMSHGYYEGTVKAWKKAQKK